MLNLTSPSLHFAHFLTSPRIYVEVSFTAGEQVICFISIWALVVEIVCVGADLLEVAETGRVLFILLQISKKAKFSLNEFREKKSYVYIYINTSICMYMHVCANLWWKYKNKKPFPTYPATCVRLLLVSETARCCCGSNIHSSSVILQYLNRGTCSYMEFL